MFFSTLLLLAAVGSQTAMAKPAPRTVDRLPPARTIFQLQEKGTWFENIAARSNGDLLVTMTVPNASVYWIEQPLSDSPKTTIIDIPNANGTLGIAETRPDVFVVISNYNYQVSSVVPGSEALWEIDLTGEAPTKRLVTYIPESGLLNGIVAVPGCQRGAVLVSDSALGQTWRVDTKTGKYEVAAKFPEMDPAPNATPGLGINGIKIKDGYLYWTNTNYQVMYRVPIDRNGFAASNATVEQVATFTVTNGIIDDFEIDGSGNFWVATNADNDIQVAKMNGHGVEVAGSINSLELGGDSALVFGRTKDDSHILYASCAGAYFAPVNGTETVPAFVAAVDTTGFRL